MFRFRSKKKASSKLPEQQQQHSPLKTTAATTTNHKTSSNSNHKKNATTNSNEDYTRNDKTERKSNHATNKTIITTTATTNNKNNNTSNASLVTTTTTMSTEEAEFLQQASYLVPAHVCILSLRHSVQSSINAADANEGELPNVTPPTTTSTTTTTTDALLQLWNAADAQKQSHCWTVQDLLREWQSLMITTTTTNAAQQPQVPQMTCSRPCHIQTMPLSCLFESRASTTTNAHSSLARENAVTTTTGTKRALLVGIQYTGQAGQLNGSLRGGYSAAVQQYLQTRQGFLPHNVHVLTDEQRHSNSNHNNHSQSSRLPTRQAIVRALQSLVLDSQAGDVVYVHFCGHGGLLYAEANDFKASRAYYQTQRNHYEETLYPLDHDTAGQIRDFTLVRHFVAALRRGVTATIVVDCHYGGSVVELPYTTTAATSTATALSSPYPDVVTRRNFVALANLAFLRVLAGQPLPHNKGFDNVQHYLEQATGVALQDYLGIGLALEDVQGVAASENEEEEDDTENDAWYDDGGGYNDENDNNKHNYQYSTTTTTTVNEKMRLKNDKQPYDRSINSFDGQSTHGRQDCDCFGGGILSFFLGLLGISGSTTSEDENSNNHRGEDGKKYAI